MPRSSKGSQRHDKHHTGREVRKAWGRVKKKLKKKFEWKKHSRQRQGAED